MNATNTASVLGDRIRVYAYLDSAEFLVSTFVLYSNRVRVVIPGPFDGFKVTAQDLSGQGGDEVSVFGDGKVCKTRDLL